MTWSRRSDCTGQRFGMLTAIKKGGWKDERKKDRIWLLECDCGNFVARQRNSFDTPKSILPSCGCAKKTGLIDNKRQHKDLTGQRFGSLIAVKLTGKKDKQNKITWLLECDCGGTREWSWTSLKARHDKYRVNCGNRSNHLDSWMHYPIAPSPYPEEAGIIAKKYLHLTELPYKNVQSSVEDEKRDRLLRAAWIITYRKSLGEEISDLHEENYIKKFLRYASISVLRKKYSEIFPKKRYSKSKSTGNKMTNSTSNSYPEIQFSGENSRIRKIQKRVRFKRR